MADRKIRRKTITRHGSKIFGSRIARLIFASNLAGLAILIIGAMVLNEMRAGFVVSKQPDLVAQAILALITGPDLITGHVLPVEGGMLVGGFARTAESFGLLVRRLQAGNLQLYAFLIALGAILVICFTAF